jgi:hypothetical protein
MAGSDQEQGPVKPSEQRGGTTPDEAEVRDNRGRFDPPTR